MNYHGRIYFLDWLAIDIKYRFAGGPPADSAYDLMVQTLRLSVDNWFCEQYGTTPVYNLRINRTDITLELRSAFFVNCIDLLTSHNLSIYTWQQLLPILKYHGLLIFDRCSIYRLDLSSNVYAALNPSNFDVYEQTPSTRIHYHQDLKSPGKLTGIRYGLRNRRSVSLIVYDKRIDPNRRHDVARFGTDEFTRLEYSIGSDRLKTYGIKPIDKFSKLAQNDYLNLLNNIHKCKRVIFLHEKPFNPPRKCNKKIPQYYNPEKTVRSLIHGYMTQTQRLSLMKWLTEHPDIDGPELEKYRAWLKQNKIELPILRRLQNR